MPQTAVQLLADADAARNRARGQGGGRTSVWFSSLRNGVADQLQLEQEIRIGLECGQFVLQYQPMVDLIARQVTGVEALVRWQHPRRAAHAGRVHPLRGAERRHRAARQLGPA